LRDGDIISPKIHMKEPLARIIEDFVGGVLDEEKNISDGRFAADITRVLVAADRSIACGGGQVEI
jgi:hypothetical protein